MNDNHRDYIKEIAGLEATLALTRMDLEAYQQSYDRLIVRLGQLVDERDRLQGRNQTLFDMLMEATSKLENPVYIVEHA